MKEKSFYYKVNKSNGFKKVAREFIACCCILLMVTMIFAKYCKLTNFSKDAFYEFNNFIDKDLIDVLCVGSSHMYCHINPVQMFDDFGIVAFDLGAGSQAVPFSYYYLEEAFKTQTPSLVILDTYMMISSDDAEKENAQGNFINMNLSYTKYKALQSVDGLEDRMDILLNFPIMHNRYGSINNLSFDLEEGSSSTYLGYRYGTEMQPYDMKDVVDISSVTEVSAVSERKETYLRKCIELCKENNVDIVLVNSPFPEINEEYQQVYNLVQQIANEYEIDFFNGCLYLEQMELDYSTDYMGGRHLNYLGAEKYTRWLVGRLLEEGYEFQDRRGDERYKYWEDESKRLNYAMMRDLQYNQMEFTDLMNILQADDNLYYILSYNGTAETLLPEYRDYLQSQGIMADSSGIFVFKRGKLIWQSCFDDGDSYADYVQRNWIMVEAGQEDCLMVKMCNNNVGVVDRTAEPSVNVYVYNEFTRSYYIGREYPQVY